MQPTAKTFTVKILAGEQNLNFQLGQFDLGERKFNGFNTYATSKSRLTKLI